MASNLLAMASNLLVMASNLLAMASNLLAMASNLLAMASSLLAMASSLITLKIIKYGHFGKWPPKLHKFHHDPFSPFVDTEEVTRSAGYETSKPETT